MGLFLYLKPPFIRLENLSSIINEKEKQVSRTIGKKWIPTDN
jgi:hypothetical protein